MEQLERCPFVPGVVRLLVIAAQRQQGIVTHINRQTQEVMLLLMPAAAGHLIITPQMRPASFRQVELHIARLAKHRRDHHAIAQHVLAVEIITRRIVRELQHHRAHHRGALRISTRCFAIQVRHHAAFLFGEVAHHIAGFVIVRPWHTVGFTAMQAAVAGEQPKRTPALVDVRRSSILKAADIVAPEAKA